MSCPKEDQYCAVSCIISPVTQEALVEVNNASKKGAPLPSFVENGSISRQAPINIIVAKLRIIICPGVMRFIRFLNIKPPILIP